MWNKSTYSGPSGGCVEAKNVKEDIIALRDSKDPSGPVLQFNFGEWEAFLKGVRNNEFDLPV
jgi:hypothetical protein